MQLYEGNDWLLHQQTAVPLKNVKGCDTKLDAGTLY